MSGDSSLPSAIISDLLEFLRQEEIRFALIGAFALLAHNAGRSTFDVDFLTVDSRALLLDWSRFRDVDVRKGDFDDPLAGVVRITPPGQMSIDLVVGKWKWQAAAIDRAVNVQVMGITIPVVRRDDLCLMKIDAGSPRDLKDALTLVERAPEVVDELRLRLPDLPEGLRRNVEEFLAQLR